MANVFISYSRRDMEFTRKLHARLEAIRGDDNVWIDWEGIASAAPDFLEEIYAGIESADTFLLIVTPDSLKSEICHLEIARAKEHAKRIIPVIHIEVVGGGKLLGDIVREWFNTGWEDRARENWNTLSHINWLFFRDEDDFDAAFEALVDAINTDLDHVKFHTRLTVRAREWQSQNSRSDLVLRGDDLSAAEGWLAISQQKDPLPTSLQRAYIQASITERESEAAEQQATNRRLRYLLAAAVLFLIIAVSLSIFAFEQSQTAIAERNNAQTQESNAQINFIEAQNIQSLFVADLAQQQFDMEHYQAALGLALEAVRMRDDEVVNQQSRQALTDIVNNGTFPDQIIQHESAVRGAVWNGDGSNIFTWSADLQAQVWDTSGNRIFTVPHAQDQQQAGAIWNEAGTRILFWSDNHAAQIIDSRDGRLLASFQHDWAVSGAIWNHDESRVLTWSRDNTARVWDAADGSLLFTMDHAPGETIDYPAEPWGAIWNADESRILTWAFDYTARVWDAEDGQPLLTLVHELGEDDLQAVFGVLGASWNTDESRILSWADDGTHTARLWNAEDGAQIDSLPHRDKVSGAVWDRGKSRILTWAGDTAYVWDAADGSLLVTISHEIDVIGAVWNHVGNSILTWTSDGRLQIWEEELDWRSHYFFQHDGDVLGASWNDTDSRILTWSEDNTARVWSVCVVDCGGGGGAGGPIQAISPLFVLPHEGAFMGAGWNSDQSQILTWSWDNTARIWDAQDGSALPAFQTGTFPNDAVWNAARNRLLVRSRDTAVIWQMTDSAGSIKAPRILFTVKHDDYVAGVIWNGDESRILSWSWDDTARVWDATDGSLILTLPHEDDVTHAVWNADGSRILTWSSRETHVWDMSGNLLFTVSDYDTEEVPGAQWSQDGHRFLIWSVDNTAQLWDAAAGELLTTLEHDWVVTGARWTQDESRILTWSWDDSVKVWDAADGSLLLTFKHNDAVLEAVWSADESRIVTLAGRNQVQIWDAHTGDLLATLRHGGNIPYLPHLILNRDNSHLVTVSQDGTAQIWDVASFNGVEEEPSPRFSLPHDGMIRDAVWNSDETRLLTFPVEGRAYVWDLPENDEPASLFVSILHNVWLAGAMWSQDETQVVTWSSDRIHVSLLDLDGLIAAGDDLLFRPLDNTQRTEFFLPTQQPTQISTPIITQTPSIQ